MEKRSYFEHVVDNENLDGHDQSDPAQVGPGYVFDGHQQSLLVLTLSGLFRSWVSLMTVRVACTLAVSVCVLVFGVRRHMGRFRHLEDENAEKKNLDMGMFDARVLEIYDLVSKVETLFL